MQWRHVFTAALTLAAATLVGCSRHMTDPGRFVAEGIDGTIGCKSFEESLWRAFGTSIERNGRPPTSTEIERSLRNRFSTQYRIGTLSNNAQSRLAKIASEIASAISLRNDSGFSVAETESLELRLRRGLWLERIAQLEIGDRTTPEKSRDVDLIKEKIMQLKALAISEGLGASGCAPDTTTQVPPPPSAMLDDWKKNLPLAVYGGLKTMATIYQSCTVATHSPLGDESADVGGIQIVGRHSSGGGNIREISNLKSYLLTQPYVGTISYQRPLPNCHDVQLMPSIYDYGGKPFASVNDEKILNLFENGGTGSKELGIDCSALVYTAYASAGLKMKRETHLKASLVNGVSSSMIMEPQLNGLTCLDHASFTNKTSLAPGDLIAINGHVVMISSVGKDPFNIDKIHSISKCTPAQMNIADFNFNILQSDPSKGGIGVNQMRASYYFLPRSTIGRGMLEHAANACRAKFQSAPLISKSVNTSILRHLGTADCFDPLPIQLTKEECLISCSPVTLEPI